MKKSLINTCLLIILFLVFISVSQNCFAENKIEGIIVDVPTGKNVDPGQFITYVIKINNSSSSTKEVFIKAKLPEEWKSMQIPELIEVKAGKSKNLFLTVSVPKNEIAGKYALSLDLRSDNALLSKEIVTEVNASYIAGIGLPQRYIYMEPEQSKDSKIYIKNFGNAKDTYTLRTYSSKKVELLGLPENIELEPGEEKEFSYNILSKDSVGKANICFQINSNNLQRPAESYQFIDIIFGSKYYSKNDYYWRVPSATGIWVEGGKDKELISGGNLEIEGEYSDSLWFNTSLSSSNLSSGLDTYNLSIGNNNGEISLGNVLVPVRTIGSFSGKGINITKYHNNNIYTAGYVKENKKNKYGLSGQWEVSDKLLVDSGLFLSTEDANDSSTIAGVGAHYYITDDAYIAANISTSINQKNMTGYAMDTYSIWKNDDIYLKGKVYFATPYYAGKKADHTGLALNIRKPLSEYLYTGLTYGLDRNNISNSSDKITSLYNSYGINGSFVHPLMPSISAGYNDMKKSNLSNNQLLLSKQNYYLGASDNLGNVFLLLAFNNYKNTNHQNNIITNINNYNGKVSYRQYQWAGWASYNLKNSSIVNETTSESNLELGLKYMSKNNIDAWLKISNKNKQQKEILGINSGIKTKISKSISSILELNRSIKNKNLDNNKYINDDVFLKFKYKSPNSPLGLSIDTGWNKELIGDNSISKYSIAPGLDYYFDNDLILSAEYRQIWCEDLFKDPSYEYKITLGKSFDFPVPWIREFAEVDGVIYIDKNRNGVWDEGDIGVSDVLLSLNNTKTLSNNEGRYVFPPLESGDYELEILSPIPGTELAIDLPRKIKLETGDVETIDIPLIEVATISGKVFIDNNKTGKIGLGSSGLPGIKIILKGKDKEYKINTNPQGNYSLRVEPGKYNVQIDTDTLPKRYVCTTEEELEIEITVGEDANVNFGVYQNPREINFTFLETKTMINN